MKSQTMRKYPEYFICLMMPISKFSRDSYSWTGVREHAAQFQLPNRGLKPLLQSLAAHLFKVAVDGVARRHSELRKRIVHRCSFRLQRSAISIAARDTAGESGKTRRHFVGALDEELIGVEAQTGPLS